LPAEVLYAGDTATDMLTASGAGMYAVGVLWGFREKSELLSAGASAVVEKPEEIVRIIREIKSGPALF